MDKVNDKIINIYGAENPVSIRLDRTNFVNTYFTLMLMKYYRPNPQNVSNQSYNIINCDMVKSWTPDGKCNNEWVWIPCTYDQSGNLVFSFDNEDDFDCLGTSPVIKISILDENKELVKFNVDKTDPSKNDIYYMQIFVDYEG